MKSCTKKILIGFISFYSALALLQVWFDIFDIKTFVKISITFLVVLVVGTAIKLINNYYDEENSLKKDKYLN